MKFKDLNNYLKFSANDSDAIFNDKHRALKNYRLMQWAKAATFGLYIVAVFMLYVADIWGIASFLQQKSNDWVALIVFTLIAFTLSFFLASSKESAYEDIALHRAEGYRLTVAQWLTLALFLSSGLLFELFSTSNNQQHIANAAAENSAMFKSVTEATPTLSMGSAALVTQLQEAEKRLAACEVKLAQGKVKDCAQSQANLNAVKEAMNRADALAQQTNAAALDAKTKAMLEIREHFDKPVYQSVGKAVGGDNNTGMIIVIAVLIFIFEMQHIIAMITYSNALRRLKLAGAQPAAESPVGIAPALAAFADNLQTSPKAQAIATEYAKANTARRELYQAAANKLDTLENADAKKRFYALLLAESKARVKNGMALNQPELENLVTEVFNKHSQTLGLKNTVSPATVTVLAHSILQKLQAENTTPAPTFKPEMPHIVETSGFKQSPAQRAKVDELYQQQLADYYAGKTFREAIRDGENVYPTGALDAPLATLPCDQQAGKTGIHNPVLGTQEAVYEMPLPVNNSRVITRVSDTQNTATQEAADTRDLDENKLSASLYAELKSRVITREISPTYRPVIQWLAGKQLGRNQQQRQQIAAEALERLHQDGVVKLNPANDGTSIKKAKYVLA